MSAFQTLAHSYDLSRLPSILGFTSVYSISELKTTSGSFSRYPLSIERQNVDLVLLMETQVLAYSLWVVWKINEIITPVLYLPWKIAKHGLTSNLISIRGTPDEYLAVVQGNAVSLAISTP